MSQTDSAAWDASLLVPRPLSVLQGLPVADQWEVTRRHPYYLLYWNYAQRFQRQESRCELETELDLVATMILYFIGVTRDYPPPCTEAAELTQGMLPAWLNGAIAPLTYRTMAASLIMGLSPACREVIAALREVHASDPNDTEAQLHVMTSWLRLESAELDSIPASPAISINLEAPLEDILKAVENQVKAWKRDRQVPNRRRREDKVAEYLKVWDQREGWTGEDYDPLREMKLREIAREMDCSVGTVKSRYQSAFRLIVGHDYTAELWDRLFAAYKFQKYLDGSCSTRRPRRSRLPGRAQIVNETDLRQATQGQGSTRIESLHHSIYADVRELLAEIRDLVQKGWDDLGIVNELSLTTNRAVEIVQWARKHPDVDVDVE